MTLTHHLFLSRLLFYFFFAFFLVRVHRQNLYLRLRAYGLLKILNSSKVDPCLNFSVPLLILGNVVGSEVKTLEFGIINLHHHFHDPAEMVFVFGLPDAETLQGEYFKFFGKYLQIQSIQLDLPDVPFAHHRLLDIQSTLLIFKFAVRKVGERFLQELNPTKISSHLLIPVYVAYFLPVGHEIIVWFYNTLTIFQLLETFPDLLLHVCELHEYCSLGRLVRRNFYEFVKDCLHFIITNYTFRLIIYLNQIHVKLLIKGV